MLKNYILVTIRNFINKEKLMFFIIVTGIGLSISIFLLLTGHVKYEDSYDTFFDDSENIYRIQTDFTNKNSGELLKFPMLPSTMTDLIRERVPEVENITWISPKLNCTANLVDDDNVFNLEHTFLADSNFFEVFSLKFLVGNPKSALNRNHDIVLSQSSAKRLFGDENPLNKQIRITWAAFDDKYTVTGVFEDVPENSHLKIDALITQNAMREQQREWNYHYTYLKLYDNKKVSDIEKKGKQLYEELYMADLVEENLSLTVRLSQINSIHLYSDVSREIKERGDYQLIQLIKILSALILIICIINYLNLSSAQYAKRSDEIDLRKALGASYRNFQAQIFVENLVVISIGVLVGIIALYFALPFYAENFGVPITPATFFSFKYVILIVMFVAILAILATIFPMFIFFSNGKSKRRGKKSIFNFRNVFIGIQYVLVTAIVFSMLVITSQVNYMGSKDLGFEKEGILFMNCPPLNMSDQEKLGKMKLLMDELEPLSEVVSVSNSLTIPGRFYNNLSSFSKVGDSGDKIIGYFSNADFNFIETYGIKLLAGRNFYSDYSDNYGIIINNTLRESLGFQEPEEAIGKKIQMNDNEFTVIGVIGDMHQNHMREKIEPWALVMVYKASSFISVKCNSGSPSQETINRIEAAFKKVFPGAPFDYKYMEEFYGRLLKQDRNLANLSIIISAIIMFLSVMGLISVSNFIIRQRVKEIAVRKVLGGTFIQNFMVLLKDYVIILVIAIVLAMNVSVYYMFKWLENFSYKVSLSVGMIVIPVLVVLIMTVSVVLYNAIRVELSNPIKSLKSE